MRVACFCGITFDATEGMGCPLCGEPVRLLRHEPVNVETLVASLREQLDAYGSAPD